MAVLICNLKLGFKYPIFCDLDSDSDSDKHWHWHDINFNIDDREARNE